MTWTRHPRSNGAISSIVEPPLAAGDAELRFADRRDAGRRLAAVLAGSGLKSPVVVVGIPRGGMPVAAEVAWALGAPLDLVVVRKVGAPGNSEYAIGALAEGDVAVIDDEAVAALGLDAGELEGAVARARRELAERLARPYAKRPRLPVAGRTVILVDDGLATGHTAQAAACSLRARGTERVVMAVPVAAPGSAQRLREWGVDDVVCVQEPANLWAIGLWYEDFGATSEQEVEALLLAEQAGAGAREVEIVAAHGVALGGQLTVPSCERARGVVVFAHGSGSSRHSPRNRQVARGLNEAGFATLLFDLLSVAEERDRANVFDIPLLAQRLLAATRYVRRQRETARLALGYFGASTGSAAALLAAAELRAGVRAVVSRGGRPDLAQARLREVVAPVLLIVGGADREVLELNRAARRELRCESELAVVPGAGHLFEESGALDVVARLAIDWFTRHLGDGARAPDGQGLTLA